MGNSFSGAFIGSCWDRNKAVLSSYVESESGKTVYHSTHSTGAIPRRSLARQSVVTPVGNNSVLASPRVMSQVDRDDHILLSARSIAIQKKAPLFRDNGEQEFVQNDMSPALSARKMDMKAIQQLVAQDSLKSNGRLASTPQTQKLSG